MDGRTRVFLILTALYSLTGCDAEECDHTVISKRSTIQIAEGQDCSLSCKVQHCGTPSWEGGWVRVQGHFYLVNATTRHHLSNRTLSQNISVLSLKISRANVSDTGLYQCQVRWPNNRSSSGHVTTVNVTEAIPEAGRSVVVKVMVCATACLCLPLVLLLTRCLCPTCGTQEVVDRSRPGKELVYLSVAFNKSRRPGRVEHRDVQPATLYAALHFPESTA